MATEQTTAQVEQQSQAVEFDVNNLPPEFARYVDQQRTIASQTASANTRKKLEHDEEFLKSVRTGMQEEVQTTVQKSVQEQLDALSMRASTAEVTSILAKAGVEGEQLTNCLDMFVSPDIEKSIGLATNFTKVLNDNVQHALSTQQQQALANMTTPASNGTNSQITLEDQFREELKSIENLHPQQRAVAHASIIRRAAEQNIKL